MNLNDLKPAWRQFRLINSMQPIDQEEILLIIERADRETISRLPRFMTNTIVFVILIICCQAG
jgi:hypothetical protein